MFVSKLPVRQVTISVPFVGYGVFSKLPVRQVTV